eukprot:CAMPEP_0171031082 /NCGR_PEP_ID=MMETSP0736-20130129/37420_1 /TAXON_ID=186038 /ORGANISM="Fragilariopsis kerguelensis, Strain L26-C5" /LENGTH=136 /DNA_ID=CAMNT_0011473249 /DNA_START=39 /DNA_END=449 /DNA_ORIENTATION=-
MLPDGNNNKSKPIINNNVSCQESSRVDSEQTSTKVASQGSFRKKNEKDNSIVTGNDIDDDDDDDDDIEEQFEDFFSTPPEEFPPQESKKIQKERIIITIIITEFDVPLIRHRGSTTKGIYLRNKSLDCYVVIIRRT